MATQRWEYEVVTVKPGGLRGFLQGVGDNDLRSALGPLGVQGWELVSTLYTSTDQGALREVVLILKRPA